MILKNVMVKKMTVKELITLLEGNEYGNIIGKERVINVYVNGHFYPKPEITLDGWGDGLVTNITINIKGEEG